MTSASVHAKALGLVVVVAASAVALNVGILRATAAPPAENAELAATMPADRLVIDVPAASSVAEATTSLAVASTTAVPAAASAPTPSATPVGAAVPMPTTPAPADVPAPTTSAAPVTTAPPETVASATTYHTYTVAGVAEIVIANHGSSLEFWAAYPAGGWEYAVEDAVGREIKVGFRGGGGEVEWKAKLEGGEIRIETEHEAEEHEYEDHEEDEDEEGEHEEGDDD